MLARSTSYKAPHYEVLFEPNILLSTLISNTLSLCSSLNVRDQVSHPGGEIKKSAEKITQCGASSFVLSIKY
jgi:hypothetical protein